MAKMTNAQLRQLDKLSDEKESAVNEIYGMLQGITIAKGL